MREVQRVMERFVSLWGAESFSVDAKRIPRESISARTSVRSVFGEPVPNEKELFEMHGCMDANASGIPG
jgi:hypothetical protein